MFCEDFTTRARKAISSLKSYGNNNVLLIHHNDADGLSSAAIIKEALERAGYNVSTFCLEKVYPEVLRDIHSKSKQVLFYVDIGSSHSDLISELNSSRNLVVIIDHHDPAECTDSMVFDLNLERFGYRGETEFSSATCSYLFACVLSESNRDLSYLALTGSQEIPAGLIGLNREVLERSLENGVVRKSGKKLVITKFNIDVGALFSALQVLGSVGYYKGGPELGIQACFSGISRKTEQIVKELELARKNANKKLLYALYRKGLNETEHIQWFDAGDIYSGMGTKVIGTFCSFLSYQRRLVKPNKYILGYMNMSPEIPKWGRLKGDFVKVSVRMPKSGQKLIDSGDLPDTLSLLVKACGEYGLADGHSYAASAVLESSRKSELIDRAERFILGYKSKS